MKPNLSLLAIASLVTLALAWAFNSSEAMQQCLKRHSVEVCQYNIR
jgi:hypothetical protein